MAEIERYLIGRVELGKTTTGKPVVDLYAADGRLQFPVLRLFDLSLLQTVGIDPNNLGAEPVYNRFWAYYVKGEKENRQGRRYKDVQYLELIDKPATTTSVDNSALLAELRVLARETRAIRALLQTLVAQNAGEALPPDTRHLSPTPPAAEGGSPQPAPAPEPVTEEPTESELDAFFNRPPRIASIKIPAGINAGMSLGWLLEHDLPYLERIAREAQNADLRTAAADLLNWSRNGGNIRSSEKPVLQGDQP